MICDIFHWQTAALLQKDGAKRRLSHLLFRNVLCCKGSDAFWTCRSPNCSFWTEKKRNLVVSMATDETCNITVSPKNAALNEYNQSRGFRAYRIKFLIWFNNSKHLHPLFWFVTPSYTKPWTESYLCASLKEKAFESRAGAHQGLDAILRDLITPGDVELLEKGTTLTDRGKTEKDEWGMGGKKSKKQNTAAKERDYTVRKQKPCYDLK